MKKLVDALTKERGIAPSDMLLPIYLQWLGFIAFLGMSIWGITTDILQTKNVNIYIGMFLVSLLFVPVPQYQRWLKIQYDSFVAIGKFVGILVLGVIVIWGCWKVMIKAWDWVTPDKWDLIVCETRTGNGIECQDNSYVIPGFSSKKECMLEGATRFYEQGFECGSNCEAGEFAPVVCDVVCNKAGCN